jgi:hypothetical protein
VGVVVPGEPAAWEEKAEVETGFVAVVTVGFQDPTVLKVRRVLLVKRLVPKGNL